MIVGRAGRRFGEARPVDAVPAAELRAWLIELRASLAPESIAGYVRSLLALADERERALAVVLLDTGLRLSKLASLRVGDVRPDGTLHVMGKGAKERIVPIGASARRALVRYLATRSAVGPGDPLFCGRWGPALTAGGIQQAIARLGRRAAVGTRCSPHTFRYTFARGYLVNGGDVFSVQQILGHATLDMVRRYLARGSTHHRAEGVAVHSSPGSARSRVSRIPLGSRCKTSSGRRSAAFWQRSCRTWSRRSPYCVSGARVGPSRALIARPFVRSGLSGCRAEGNNILAVSPRLPALGPRGEGWVVAQFVLFAVIAVAGLRDLFGHRSLTPWGPAVVVVGITAILVGCGLAARGIWDLRYHLSPFPRPIAGAPLVESGAYRLIRHPIYSGLALAAIGWGLVAGSTLAIAAAGLLFLLFAGKSRREEAWLVAIHPEYRAYQRRTKRLIPWIY